MSKETKTLQDLISEGNKRVNIELRNKNDIVTELNQEILNLKGAQENIKVFLDILYQEKNTSFGNLKKRNIKIEELYGAILTFVNSNSNSNYLKEKRTENIYLNYFLDFLHYLNIKNEIGSLHYFNFRIIENIENLSPEEKNVFVFINDDIFIRQVVSEIGHLIDFLIDGLEDELEKENPTVVEGKVKEVKDSTTSILLLEDRLFNYYKYFENILYNLFVHKEDNMGIILNNKLLLVKLEFLMNFIDNNKDKIIKEEKGELIYDFINGINKSMLDKTFSEFTKDLEIKNRDLISLDIDFKELTSKIDKWDIHN